MVRKPSKAAIVKGKSRNRTPVISQLEELEAKDGRYAYIWTLEMTAPMRVMLLRLVFMGLTEFDASHSTFAEWTRLSVNQVRGALKRLLTAGLLKVVAPMRTETGEGYKQHVAPPRYRITF